MKTLQFTPIYKGEFNKVPRKSKKVKTIKVAKREIRVNLGLEWIEASIMLLAIGYLVFSFIR